MAGMAGVPAWQGVPQPQLPTGQMPQLQQPASMVGAYPVQQFQVCKGVSGRELKAWVTSFMSCWCPQHQLHSSLTLLSLSIALYH